MSPVRKQHHAVVQAEHLQQRFRIAHQRFQLLVTLLGPREFEQLHFLKLVLPEDAARVLACGAGLGAEAGGPGASLDRASVGVQRFVAIAGWSARPPPWA